MDSAAQQCVTRKEAVKAKRKLWAGSSQVSCGFLMIRDISYDFCDSEEERYEEFCRVYKEYCGEFYEPGSFPDDIRMMEGVVISDVVRPGEDSYDGEYEEDYESACRKLLPFLQKDGTVIRSKEIFNPNSGNVIEMFIWHPSEEFRNRMRQEIITSKGEEE